MLEELGPEIIHDLLLDAYFALPEVEILVNDRHADFMTDQRAQKARLPPVRFDSRSKACRYALNTMNKGLKSSKNNWKDRGRVGGIAKEPDGHHEIGGQDYKMGDAAQCTGDHA